MKNTTVIVLSWIKGLFFEINAKTLTFMQKAVAICKSDVYYMSSPVGSDLTGSEEEKRF